MTKKRSMFYTDSQGRVRYMDNDRGQAGDSGTGVCSVEAAPQQGEKGRFITKDNRVIFIGGPGSGRGTGSSRSTGEPQNMQRFDVADNIVLWDPNSQKYERVWATYQTTEKNLFTGKPEQVDWAITPSGHRSLQVHKPITGTQAAEELERMGYDPEDFFKE